MGRKARPPLVGLQELEPMETEETEPEETPVFNHHTHDFTGWHYPALPYDVPKAARCGSMTSDVIVGQVECTNCRRPIWTCSAEKEDVCDECEVTLIDQYHELRVAQQNRVRSTMVNPFGESHEPMQPSFWPKKSDF